MGQWWAMLSAVVGPVESAWGPNKSETDIGRHSSAASKTHVHRLGLARHDGVVSNSGGGVVIGL